jgi:hypothetical protein
MKYSKRSFAVVSVFLAVPVSFGIGTLYARDAEPATVTLAAAQAAKQQCMKIVRVSGCLPGLHPIHLYWPNRTRMSTFFRRERQRQTDLSITDRVDDLTE